MNSKIGFFGLALLTGLAASIPGAAASWYSSYLMAPNQGYCNDARVAADVRWCPENRRYHVVPRKRLKTRRSPGKDCNNC